MMTIKHVARSGEEYVYATSHVNFVPTSALGLGSTTPDTLWHYGSEGDAQPITDGTVFVMNEHGKTVSKYELGAKHGISGQALNSVNLGTFQAATQNSAA